MGDVFGGANRVVLRVERDGILVDELLLLRVRRSVVAVVNRCPHLGRRLDDARARGGALRCRGHGRTYSLRTGRAVGTLSAVAPARLTRVPAWTESGQLLLDLSALS
jgi:nitrite reductase/ring-hydroxylating ferredoxin subunit